jgi:hypothetical protein
MLELIYQPKGKTMSRIATADETEFLTEQLEEIETTANKGFHELAVMMGAMAGMVERTGARFVPEMHVGGGNASIEFKLVFDNIGPHRRLDINEQLDVTMVTEFARVFADRFLVR